MNQSVMFLCNYQSPYGGNFIPSLVELEEYLRKIDVDVVYVFAEKAIQYQWFQELKARGKQLELCEFNKGKRHILKEIQRLSNKYNVSILHSHFVSFSTVELFAIIKPTVKVIIHAHSDFSGGKNSWKLRMRDYLVYGVFAKNVNFLSVMPSLVNKNVNKIKYLPNALSNNRIICDSKKSEAIREMLKVQQGELLIEIFGWSPYIKGIDIAVNAVKLINEKGKKIKLAIICGNEMTSKRMREWIDKHTTCTGNEEFLCYLDPTEDVFSYHEAADILLSASRSEGFSYAILEMLSLGKKCVISDIPGIVWAKKYTTVICFETESVEACAKGIWTAIESLPYRNNSIAEQVKEEYDINSWISAVIKEYGI